MLLLFFAAIGGGGVDPPPPVVIPGGNGGAIHGLQTERLPKVRRRGLPAIYTRRADQIERNNQAAMELTRLIVEELTADD